MALQSLQLILKGTFKSHMGKNLARSRQIYLHKNFEGTPENDIKNCFCVPIHNSKAMHAIATVLFTPQKFPWKAMLVFLNCEMKIIKTT